MAERYDILAKVISQKGHCAAGHNVSDEWVIGSHTPEGMCIPAFNSMLPKARALMYGGALPYGDNPYVTTVACPDAQNPLVLELSRIQQ
jgi:uncharacterized repeat protein (TIGR04076 family)